MIRDFPSVVQALSGLPGVGTSRMFGSDALKADGKVFAMLVKGALVVKLSQVRATELVAAGVAEAFDPGHGRPMRQWVAVDASATLDWLELSQEALAAASTETEKPPKGGGS